MAIRMQALCNGYAQAIDLSLCQHLLGEVMAAVNQMYRPEIVASTQSRLDFQLRYSADEWSEGDGYGLGDLLTDQPLLPFELPR